MSNVLASHPLYHEAAKSLQERLRDVHLPFPLRHEWQGQDQDNIAPASQDLITACLSLTPASDWTQELSSIYAALKAEGLFLGVILSGESLHELRACLIEAESAVAGGASPRLYTMPDPQSLGRALLTTGFTLPVVDTQRVTLVYDDLYALLRELQEARCTPPLPERSRCFTRRAVFEKANKIYAERHSAAGGGITTTLDLVFLHGWKE
ncbi:MAG: hypothetical protein WC612_00735 [Bdellovibrionales bacterium]|jgi:hypothetical protein